MSETNYDEDRLFALLFNYDQLLHNRVNMFLLTQTVFIAVAASGWQKPSLVVALSVPAVLTAVLFFLSTVKLYWRVIWLLNTVSVSSPELQGLLDLAGRENMRFTGFDQRLQSMLLAKNGRMPTRLKDTGFLFTWGLLSLTLAGWAAMLATSIYFN